MTRVPVEIEERNVTGVDAIAEIPIAFEVDRVFIVERRADGELTLLEATAARSFVKDYDRIPGNAPSQWSDVFDLSNWGLLTAKRAGELVGCVLIAFDTPDLDLLAGRGDIAAIWDIRVRPEERGQGVGTALMRAAEGWARAMGCSELMVETQNINVGACRLYERSGFQLREADAEAYPDFPDETQLIWTKHLTRAAA